MKHVFAAILALSFLAPHSAHAASVMPDRVEVNVTGRSGVRSVPAGAQRVSMLTVELRNLQAETLTVESMTLAHKGLGDPEDLTSIYAIKGVRRVTRGQTVNTGDRTVTLRFAPALKIAPRESATLTVAADYSANADAAGEHALTLEDPADIVSTASDMIFNNVAEGDGVSRTVGQRVGTITVEYLPVNGTVRYGADRLVGRIKLTADNVSDHDLIGITLTNDGKARDDDIRNLRLESNARKALTAEENALRDDVVTFAFEPPYRLGKNESVILNIRADVRASRRKTVRFVVEEPSDIEAVPAARR